MNNKKILAIDYGTKRVGLAITDEEGSFAFSYKILDVKSEEDALEKIIEVVNEEAVTMLLFGLPLDANGEDTPFSKEIKSFIKKLQEELPVLPIETWNEILTSKLAEETAKTVQYKRKMIDSEAARIILQEYLDNNQ